jgi:acetyltransferase-like isoleucine patch superfamily enzyme
VEKINTLIRKLGKKNYSVDKNLSKKEMFIIMAEKLTCLIRGFYYRLFFKKCEGLLFVGRRCKIKHCHKISVGRTITIGGNVEINALSISGITFGNNVSIQRNTIIECTGVIRHLGEGLVIGNNVGIAQNCFIQVRGKVTIGNDVMLGPGVSIFSENHGFSDIDIPMLEQPESRKGVTIENDVWLGTGAIILDGVTIGKGSIIAAGSLVKSSVPPYSIVAGVPGKILRSRK